MMLFPGHIYSQGVVDVMAFVELLGMIAFVVQIYKQLQHH